VAVDRNNQGRGQIGRAGLSRGGAEGVRSSREWVRVPRTLIFRDYFLRPATVRAALYGLQRSVGAPACRSMRRKCRSLSGKHSHFIASVPQARWVIYDQ